MSDVVDQQVLPEVFGVHVMEEAEVHQVLPEVAGVPVMEEAEAHQSTPNSEDEEPEQGKGDHKEAPHEAPLHEEPGREVLVYKPVDVLEEKEEFEVMDISGEQGHQQEDIQLESVIVRKSLTYASHSPAKISEDQSDVLATP